MEEKIVEEVINSSKLSSEDTIPNQVIYIKFPVRFETNLFALKSKFWKLYLFILHSSAKKTTHLEFH